MLSVVIPAYNEVNDVLSAVNSLQAMQRTPEVQYLVQDDASPDALFPAVIPASIASTERNATNLGFAGNCNAGAARAIGDVLLFVNQDVYAAFGWSEGWDAALLAGFNRDPKIGIVAPRLLFPNGAVQSAGGVFDVACQPVHRFLNWSNVHHPLIATASEVDWATGAALAIRRECWEQVGGFDAAYGRGYFEDVDFCLKARELGWRVWYEPRSTLFHSVGSTGGSPSFAQNARLWKRRWVDSGKVKPGVMIPTVRYW